MERHPAATSQVRASDAERERAAHALGAHLVAGRLKLDEFSARVDRAYRASTLAELQALTADLPTPTALSPSEAPAPARSWRLPFWPGNLPFITRFETSAAAKTVMGEAMRTVVPRLLAEGYTLETSQPRLLVLSRTHRPGWTIALSVLLFPLGLLALLHEDRCQVVLTVQAGRETTVEVAGTAPLGVRRAVSMLALAE